MKQARTLFVTVMALTALSAGCASTIPSLKSLSSPSRSESAILLAYEFRDLPTESMKQDCTVQLTNLSNNRSYVMTVSPEKNLALVEAPPGAYEATLLRCAGLSSWDLRGSLRKILVYPAKASYTGKITFNFQPGNVTPLRVAYADRPTELKAFGDTYKKLDPSIQGRIISSANGRPITPEMLAHPGEFHLDFHFKATGTKGMKFPGDPDLLTAASRCEAEENERSPIRIGTLSYLVTYDQGRLKGIEKKVNAHAFSAAFEACLDEAFRKNPPQYSGKVEVFFNY